jgi:hypothetical protein
MGPSDAPPWLAMMQLLTGSWVAQAVGAAARLAIPDHLAAGQRTAAQLAAATGASVDGLARLCRALVSLGVLGVEGDAFTPTPLSDALRTGVPGSLRELAMAETDQAHWAPWGRFTEAVRTGKPQAEAALGMQPWDYYGQHPEDARVFSEAMGNVSRLAVPAVLGGYDFSQARTVVDVGGAHGYLLAAILGASPAARGILFDLPHVTAQAGPVLERLGVADRVELVPGSFLEHVPAGGDLYVLKHILHDWDDDTCLTILRACRAAMSPQARMLIVEMLLPPPGVASPAALMDLNMLVLLGGRERDEREFRALLTRAGLELARVIFTPSPFVLLEARHTPKG